MSHTEICYASATKQAAWIQTKKISPVEVMQAHLERIQSLNPSLNAVVTLADGAMERSRRAEMALMKGENWGPLHGVPFTAKDCFDTAGTRTTRGSKLFENRVPSQDATAVLRLRQAGAILLGKTNLPEFALWDETSNKVFGQTNNPWNPEKTPGGSSGGEAAAIAAGFSPLGIGTDLGGSNRLPAHYCGIVGFKPTHGRIPLSGQWPELMTRYFHVGTLSRTVEDTALALSILLGPDGKDPYAIPLPAPHIPSLSTPLPPLEVGWLTEGPFAPVDEAIQGKVREAAATLEDLGCRTQPVFLKEWRKSPPIQLIMDVLVVEATQYFEPIITGREDQLSPAVQQLLNLPVPSLRVYVAALAACEQLRHDMMKHFSSFDLLLLPTGPITAHAHNAVSLEINHQTTSRVHAASITPAFGITGSPAISVPAGLSPDGLPIGVQLVARHFEESILFHVAAALEKGFLRPPVFSI